MMKINKVVAPLVEIAPEYLEIGIDCIFNDEVLQTIPVVNTTVALAQSVYNIPSSLFLRKLNKFCYAQNQLSDEEKRKFKEKIIKYKNKEKLGEMILYTIDKAETSEKAEFIGKAAKLIANEKIDIETYIQLCYRINKCSLSDLRYLSYFTDEKKEIHASNDGIEEEILTSLFSAGFLLDMGIDAGCFNEEPSGTVFSLNKYGRLTQKLLND